MNINDFEEYVNKTILNRGYNYYIDGNVSDIYDEGENMYTCEVQGSDLYEVSIELDDSGEIIDSQCDCPYDFGPICKHEVAAYYELLDMFKDNAFHKKREIVKQPKVEDILNSLSKEELVKILVDLVRKDKALKNSIILKYSKDNEAQELERYKRLIEAIARRYKNRDDYIPLRETYAFADEMETILENARNKDDIILSLEIATLLVSELVKSYEYADDSDGRIGSLVTDTFLFIEEVIEDAEELDIDLKEKIFNLLLKESSNEAFWGWDNYKIQFLRLCTYFSDVEVLRIKLIRKIELIISQNSDSEFKRYYNEMLLQIVFQIIEEYGTKEEAEEYIKANLIYTYFRELLINRYFEAKDYNKAIELALEGEIKDKQYPGLVSKWKNIRYNAYKKLGLKDEQIELARELFFNGDFNYYRELKQLSTESMSVFYNDLKEELKRYEGRNSSALFLELILEEKDLDELIKYVRNHPKTIEKYADLLYERYKDEVLDIYTIYIKIEAENARQRNAYQRVCGIIKRYKKFAGKKNQEKVIYDLIFLYRKRPAFLDELRKIK